MHDSGLLGKVVLLGVTSKLGGIYSSLLSRMVSRKGHRALDTF
jgi:hypothetical protein